MATSFHDGLQVAWWREPTRDQWHAWIAAWLGWTLDAFDFTIFVLIMLPIAQEFDVPLTAVTAVFTLTLWLRLVGATGSGWLADRIGRKKPLMISIAWFSLCNFIAGFSPSFAFLFFFRALLGIGMGAEWPVGASLAMETLADPLARLHGGGDAGIMGPGWPAVSSRLRAAVQFDRLAWPALDRRFAGVGDPLRAQVCQRAARLGRESTVSARSEARSSSAAAVDLQARSARQHADCMLVDGEQFCRRLLDRQLFPTYLQRI